MQETNLWKPNLDISVHKGKGQYQQKSHRDVWKRWERGWAGDTGKLLNSSSQRDSLKNSLCSSERKDSLPSLWAKTLHRAGNCVWQDSGNVRRSYVGSFYSHSWAGEGQDSPVLKQTQWNLWVSEVGGTIKQEGKRHNCAKKLHPDQWSADGVGQQARCLPSQGNPSWHKCK